MNQQSLNQRIQSIFDRASFVQLLGIQLLEVEAGWCSSQLQVEERHLQHLGRVHGAALAALAGQTALGAAESILGEGEYTVCPHFNVQLLKPAGMETLISKARVVKSGKRLVFVESFVSKAQDDTNGPIAMASYTFSRLRHATNLQAGTTYDSKLPG